MTPALSPREAYRLWAPSYRRETALSALERRGVATFAPGVGGRTLLDVGCGTGRRLRDAEGAVLRIGVDLVPAMLTADRPQRAERGNREDREGRADQGDREGRADREGPADREAVVSLAAGDMRALPFRADAFDAVWCRLVLGHVPQLGDAYRELGRVARSSDAHLVVTDFHPAAADAGHARTFRDPGGVVREVAHHRHDAEDHRRAAADAGWRVDTVHDLTPDEEERPYWTAAGRGDRFDEQRDLPLVLQVCLSR